MSQFKKGDSIRCVSAKDIEHLTEGKVYEALRDSYTPSFHPIERVEFLDNTGEHSTLYASRFTLQKPKDMIPEGMIPEGMEAFDLDAALDSPNRIFTRDGRPVKLADYNEDAEPHQRIAGWVNGDLMGWHSDGVYSKCSRGPEDLDLFLRAENKVWYGCDLGDFEMKQTLQQAIAHRQDCSTAVIEYTYTGNHLTDVKIVHRFTTHP